MNMEFIRKLPIPKELKAQFSLSEKLVNVKAKRDAEIKKVFTGESDFNHVDKTRCSLNFGHLF